MAASFWESSHRRTWLFERGALERAYAQMEDGLAPQERHRLKPSRRAACGPGANLLATRVDACAANLTQRRDPKAGSSRQSAPAGHRNSQRALPPLLHQVRASVVVALGLARRAARFWHRQTACSSCGHHRNLLCDYDPFLVAPTCLYLASKAEECTVQAKIWTRMQNKYDVAAMLEMEMFLIEELEYSLVVFHPYRCGKTIPTDGRGALPPLPNSGSVIGARRPLMQILADAELQELTKYSWSLVNDSYHTDICLLYPPHMCALACVYTAAVLMGKELRPWLESLNIDLDEVTNITRELLAYYESYKQGDPKQMNELIRKTTDFRAASQQQQGEHSAAAAQRAPPLPPQQ
eukprot:scaffold3324_cov371-Prasinococcus_capsulatus_cf.AAC.4